MLTKVISIRSYLGYMETIAASSFVILLLLQIFIEGKAVVAYRVVCNFDNTVCDGLYKLAVMQYPHALRANSVFAATSPLYGDAI